MPLQIHMTAMILDLCSCGLEIGLREAIACAYSRVPCCWLLAMWEEEE